MRFSAAMLASAGFIASLGAAPALADPTSDVVNAFLAFKKAASYHMSLATSRGDVEIDIVNPDKKHITVGSQMEMIAISDDMYMKMGGSWRKIPSMGMGAMFTKMAHDYASDYSTGKKRATLKVVDQGMQTVDGQSLHSYDVSDTESKSDFVISIGNDGFPHKILPKDTTNGAAIRYSRFNDPAIKIAAPI